MLKENLKRGIQKEVGEIKKMMMSLWGWDKKEDIFSLGR